MAQYPLTNIAQLSGTEAEQGLQMTEQLAQLAHPIESNARSNINIKSRVNNFPAAQELWIDGQLNYRLKGISDSTMLVTGEVTYHSNVAANCCAFTIVASMRVVAGVATALVAPTITKLGTSAAVLTAGVNTPVGCLAFTGLGVAGDTLANWVGTLRVTEATDFVG